MFKNPFQVALTFALIVLVMKLTIFYLGLQHGDIELRIWYVYLFIILLNVFFGIRSNKIASENPTSFGEDFKAGGRTASYFAILVTGIVFVYYSKIDVDFFDIEKKDVIASLPEKIKFHFEEGRLSTEEIKKHAKLEISNANKIYTPSFYAMFTMFPLVFIGIIYAGLFAFLMKKFPGFK